MRRTSTQLLVIPLVVLAVLAAAGCGGSKKSASSTTTSTTTTTTAANTTTTAAQTTTSSGSTTTASGAASLGTEVASALSGANGDPQKELSILQQYASQTPPAIRADFQTILDAFSKMSSALKTATSGGSGAAAALAELEKLNTPAVKQAEANIGAWAAKNCHS